MARTTSDERPWYEQWWNAGTDTRDPKWHANKATRANVEAARRDRAAARRWAGGARPRGSWWRRLVG